MALSHCNASEGFAEKDAGRVVLSLAGVVVVGPVGWVDMVFWGGLVTGVTILAGLTGMWSTR